MYNKREIQGEILRAKLKDKVYTRDLNLRKHRLGKTIFYFFPLFSPVGVPTHDSGLNAWLSNI